MADNKRITTKANALLNEIVTQGFDITGVAGETGYINLRVIHGSVSVESISNIAPFSFIAKRTKGMNI